MPTYQVTCSECGGERWPTLPDRPDRYVCARCASQTTAQRAASREAGQRGAQTRRARQNVSQDATEPPAGGG
jgi:hypothetical protein